MSSANLAGWTILVTLIVAAWAAGFYAYWKLAGLKTAIIIMGGTALLILLVILAAHLISL